MCELCPKPAEYLLQGVRLCWWCHQTIARWFRHIGAPDPSGVPLLSLEEPEAAQTDLTSATAQP